MPGQQPVTAERKKAFESLSEGELLELHAESLFVVTGYYCLVLQFIFQFMDVMHF